MEFASPLPLSCPDCAARMPETSAFCPSCGRTMAQPISTDRPVGRFADRLAGALAYLTFIPAIVFLARAPYNRNRFVRYHSTQCLLLWVAMLAAAALVRVIALLLALIPVAGPLLAVVISVITAVAAFLVWTVLVVKALQGEMFRLPGLGELAERNAGER
jgi:uncharacterized membrane protein